jgi:hypothetical protein
MFSDTFCEDEQISDDSPCWLVSTEAEIYDLIYEYYSVNPKF